MIFSVLGMGAHPQIALPVGKSRMDFIGKTPVGIRKAVIERTQAISSLIETRKTSAIGMHPNRTENIFVHVKSRTGTVGRCRLYQDYFRFQHFCPCIKMCNGSRNILPEPYFRVSVYINGVNRSTRQTGSRIMNSCLSGRIVSKKPSVSVTIIRLCSSIFPTATICEAQGNCNNRNRPFFF